MYVESTHLSLPLTGSIDIFTEQAKLPAFQPWGSQLPLKKTAVCSWGPGALRPPKWSPRFAELTTG